MGAAGESDDGRMRTDTQCAIAEAPFAGYIESCSRLEVQGLRVGTQIFRYQILHFGLNYFSASALGIILHDRRNRWSCLEAFLLCNRIITPMAALAFHDHLLHVVGSIHFQILAHSLRHYLPKLLCPCLYLSTLQSFYSQQKLWEATNTSRDYKRILIKACFH